jgi:hypothetical protein
MLTLNQVVTRLQTIALNHAQIKSFYFGDLNDWFTNKGNNYPACLIEPTGGTVDKQTRRVSYSMTIDFVDLLNISEKAHENLTEIWSDQSMIAADYVAKVGDNNYTDWRLESSGNLQFIKAEQGDYLAGVSLDIVISIPYDANRCAVPVNS